MLLPEATGLDLRTARARVSQIVRRVLGETPGRMEPLTGGLNNAMLRVHLGELRLVVRLHGDTAKLHDYEKERWAMQQAAAAGVPVPSVLALGTEAGGPYMLVQEIEGVPGYHARDRFQVLAELGACAARLHGIRTQGFGPGFCNDGSCSFQHLSWSDYLDAGLGAPQRLELLRRSGMLEAAAVRELAQALEDMRGWRKPPALQHGDLRLKNVIVDADSNRLAALLDWDTCLSAPAPYWDLSIALHDLGPDGKEALLDGYGITPTRFARMARWLRALNALNYAWALQCARTQGRRREAAWLKARLQGAFDVRL